MTSAVLAKQTAGITWPEFSFTFALPAVPRRCHGSAATPSG
jgi:hypothetical protein